MLTEDQTIQLNELSNHKKYGTLLKDAKEKWKHSDPISGVFGIYEKNGIWGIGIKNKCCMLGAALIGKKIIKDSNGQSEGVMISVRNYFNLSEGEIWSLVEGFDGVDLGHMFGTSKEAHEFAVSIRSIFDINLL